jgi:hypothetical protein
MYNEQTHCLSQCNAPVVLFTVVTAKALLTTCFIVRVEVFKTDSEGCRLVNKWR